MLFLSCVTVDLLVVAVADFFVPVVVFVVVLSDCVLVRSVRVRVVSVWADAMPKAIIAAAVINTFFIVDTFKIVRAKITLRNCSNILFIKSLTHI